MAFVVDLVAIKLRGGKYEVIDVIEDWGLGFHLGNVVKYVARAEHKNDAIEDLKKARWYLDRYIEVFQNDKTKAI